VESVFDNRPGKRGFLFLTKHPYQLFSPTGLFRLVQGSESLQPTIQLCVKRRLKMIGNTPSHSLIPSWGVSGQLYFPLL